MRVDQLLVGYTDGDAISREARTLREGFLALGHESDIFVEPAGVGHGMRGACRSIDELAGTQDDVLVHHFACEGPAAAAFRSYPGRRLLRYHNLTPAEWFRGLDDRLQDELACARIALGETAHAAHEVVSVSAYNAEEIRALGVESRVAPLALDLDAFGACPADEVWGRRLAGPEVNILAVGRVAPNKCLHELIEAFGWYHETIQPVSRLVLAGSGASCPSLFHGLEFYAARLDQRATVFTGFLREDQLAACYRHASLLVCVSRHEGFGLPLLEAMAYGVPVLARDAGGMPEAMGDAGLRFDGLDAPMLAELMHELVSDGNLRQRVLDSQRRHLEPLRRRKPVDMAACVLG